MLFLLPWKEWTKADQQIRIITRTESEIQDLSCSFWWEWNQLFHQNEIIITDTNSYVNNMQCCPLGRKLPSHYDNVMMLKQCNNVTMQCTEIVPPFVCYPLASYSILKTRSIHTHSIDFENASPEFVVVSTSLPYHFWNNIKEKLINLSNWNNPLYAFGIY